MTALYQIVDRYRDAAERMADLGLDTETIQDTLESIEGEIAVKAEAVAMVIRNHQSLADQIKQAERQMAERRKALEARAAWLESYLLTNMEAAGITVIEHPMFRIAVKANPPAVAVVDEASIPPEFWRVPETPPPALDKKAIAETLKAGGEVPGASLSRSTRLEIK